MKNLKIIFTGVNMPVINNIISDVLSNNEDLILSPVFTTDSDDSGANRHISMRELALSYKNNALFCISSYNNDIYKGVTMDDFYNYNLFNIDVKMYNTISNKPFNMYPILTVWINTDDDKNIIYKNKLRHEVERFQERLNHADFIYFSPVETKNKKYIINIVNNYIIGDDTLRHKILAENK